MHKNTYVHRLFFDRDYFLNFFKLVLLSSVWRYSFKKDMKVCIGSEGMSLVFCSTTGFCTSVAETREELIILFLWMLLSLGYSVH